MIVPLFGSGVFGKSVSVTAQRRINMYAEQFQDGDKTQMALYPFPGLTRQAVSVNGPIRGFSEQFSLLNAGVTTDYAFVAQGTKQNLFSPGGGLIDSGAALRTTSGPVQFAYNGTQMLYVDGRTGYIVNTLTLGPATVMEDTPAQYFPAGATSCCFIGGKFVVNDPAVVGRFRWSSTYDGTLWASLDFATAESAADPLISVLESRGELLLFGRDTLEFWAPTGGTEVFRRIGGAGIDWGMAAKNSAAKINGGVVFLGRSRVGGERQAVFLLGHNATVISSPDVTADINATAVPDSVTGFGYVVGGHTFYQLNLPTVTWLYDFTTGMWSELQTEGARHAADRAVAAFGMVLLGDYRDGRVYKLDTTAYTNDGTLMLREVWTRHVFTNLDRMTVFELQVDVEPGTGLVTGQGTDPQMMLQVSNDGGHTWGNERWRSIGKLGAYLQRAIWWQVGRARDFVFRFRMTDPVKLVIVNGAMRAG